MKNSLQRRDDVTCYMMRLLLFPPSNRQSSDRSHWLRAQLLCPALQGEAAAVDMVIAQTAAAAAAVESVA